MGGFLRESGEKTEPPGALLQTAAIQTIPGPALPLGSSPTKMGTDAARRSPCHCHQRGQPEPSREAMLLGCVQSLRAVVVGRGLALLIIGEEFGQRSRFTPLLGRL